MYNIIISVAIIVLGFLCVIECIRSGKRRKEEELRSWVSRAVKAATFRYERPMDILEFAEEFLVLQGIVEEKDINHIRVGKLEAMIFAEIYNQVR